MQTQTTRFEMSEDQNITVCETGVNRAGTGKYSVTKVGGGTGLYGLNQEEAKMALAFLNSCSDAIYQLVQSRLLWSRLEGLDKLVSAPLVEGGITINHQSRLNLAIANGKIEVVDHVK